MEMKRKGGIYGFVVNGRQYWQAAICVESRHMCKSSKDRAVCASWLADMLAAHPTYEVRRGRPRIGTTVTRRRKGCIIVSLRKGRPYYTGAVSIGYISHRRSSYDRAVVEEWLAATVAAHPICEYDLGISRRPERKGKTVVRKPPQPEPAPVPESDPGARWANFHGEQLPPLPIPRANPFAGKRVAVTETPSLWMVVAETNPYTSLMLCREFRRLPSKVLVTDLVTCAPIVWVADDNGGEGFGDEAQARARMTAMRDGTDPSVGLSVRPFSGKHRTSDNC